VLLLGGGLFSVAFVRVLGSAVAFVLFLMAFRHVTTGDDAASRLGGRMLLATALPFLVVEATRVIYQQMDTIVMSFLVDGEAIGWYATADTLYGSLLFIPVIVATAIFPAMADMHERTPHEVDAFFSRAFSGLLLVAVPIGTVLVAPSFVRLLYGPGFEDAAPVLSVFGVLVVILSTQTILLGRLALATRWPFRDMMFIVPGAIGVAVYGLVIIGTRTLDDDEVAMVRRQMARLRSR
jgi:O-antigen/teichoic acid export membrane protein